MKVAYEDLRLVPQGELAIELQAPLTDDLFDLPPSPPNRLPHRNADHASKSHINSVTQHNKQEHQYKDRALDKLLGIDNDSDDAGLPAFHANLMSDNSARDIGTDTVAGPTTSRDRLHIHEQLLLGKLYTVFGKDTVSWTKVEGAPSWLIDKAIKDEIEDAWKDAFHEVPDQQVPMNANVISSHIIYEVKVDEKGAKRLKARLRPHGNRDQDKRTIRSDSSNVQFDVMRLLLSLATVLRFTLGCIDVKAAYLQSGLITGDLYVRPPKEYTSKRGSAWKLKKLPYGVCEAGQQWAKTIENWLTKQAGLQRLTGVSELYIMRKENGTISILLGILTDDLLLAGTGNELENFVTAIEARFSIGKVFIDDTIMFNGCVITQTKEGDIYLSMSQYLENIKPALVTPGAPVDSNSATDTEIHDFRRLAGEPVWLGSGALP